MKHIIILSLFIWVFLFACKQKDSKSPIEGAWKLVYASNTVDKLIYPENVTGERIKMWTETHFTFAGSFRVDSINIESYGWGTYTLEGNKYVETIKLHRDKSNIGKKLIMLLELRNDTLIQKYPADEQGVLNENYHTEKHIRIE